MFQSLIVLRDGDDESSVVVDMNETVSSDTDRLHQLTLTVTDTPHLTPVIHIKLVSTRLVCFMRHINSADNCHNHTISRALCLLLSELSRL